MNTYNLPLKEIREFSNSIESLKNKFSSTRNLTNSPHFYGKIGEFIFQEEFGLKADTSIAIGGDNQDFIINGLKIDIKTTTYWRDPLLREFKNPRKAPDIYVLISIKGVYEDVETVEGEIVGWCYANKLLNKPLSHLGNLGERHLLNKDELENISKLKEILWL